MTGSLPIHVGWLLATIGTFVLGTQLAQTSMKERAANARDAGNGGLRASRATPLPTIAAPAERGAAMPPRPGAKSRERSAVVESADPMRTGDTAAFPVRRLPDGSIDVGSLRKEDLTSLVRTAIKSSNPVERRQAFDQLLESMQSGRFTLEQTLMVRTAMTREGASGEQWRLFDYAWGATDPDAAVAYIDEISEQHRLEFLRNMIPGLASVDPQAAIGLFADLNPDLQARIRSRLFEGLVDNDIAVATDYIYDATDPAEGYNWRPMDTLTREIAKEEGVAATLRWAEGLPEGPLRASAWSAAYAVWGAREPETAVQALIDLPPSDDRNLAINGFSAAVAPLDGESAVLWAAEISAPGLREAAVVRAGQQFYKQDQVAATDWFLSSGLPETAWQKIIGPVPRR